MKKIITAFDGYKFSESAKECTTYLAKQNNVHPVGVFLDDEIYHSYRISDIRFEADSNLKQLNQEDREKRALAVTLFEAAMQIAKLNYSIHRPNGVAFNELLHETIYSDLLILYKNETFTNFEETAPTRFVRELLAESQCPVLLVPYTFRPFNKVVLLYNGKPSSVQAIKMFSYLLPSFKHLPTEVLTINDEKKTLHLPDNKLMKEFMHRHFPEAAFTVFKGDTEEEIINFLKMQDKNTLVVLGSSQRNMISRLFRRGIVDALIEKIELPIFTAHTS